LQEKSSSFSGRRTGAHRRRGAACLAALALAGCGERGRPADGSPRAVLRLELHPTAPASAQPGPALVAQFRVESERPDWEVRADASEVRSVLPFGEEAPVRVLELSGSKAMRVDLPLAPGARDFNRVALSVFVEGIEELSVVQRRGGEILRQSRVQRVQGPGVRQDLAFDFPPAPGTDRATNVSVVFAARGGRVGLESATLLRAGPHEVLGSADGPARPMHLAGEWRCGWPVTRGRPLSSEVVPIPGGARLAFSFAAPPATGRPRLAVRAVGARGRAELVAELEPKARWQSVELALPRRSSGARIELALADEGGEAVCAVTRPALISGAPASEPTLVLVTSDTHRADHLGALADGAGVRTPFLDALAARGVLFEDCWSSTNTTNPSHVALMTGTSPRDTRVADNHTPLAPAAPTLAEAFQAAGFLTFAAVSVPHLGPEESGLGQGFDRYFAPRGSQCDSRTTAERLASWLADAEGQPLFVWLHVFDAHTPYEPNVDFTQLYYAAGRSPREGDLPLHAVPKWSPEVRDLEWMRALYKGEVSYLDRTLGEVLAHPRLARASVAVTADHGESLGAHGVYFDHRELYPDSLAVPLILAGPGVPGGEQAPDGQGGARVRRPVRQVDVGRTLLALAGVESDFPGQDLLAAEPGPAVPRFALAGDGLSASVQSESWFLVLHLRQHRASPERPPVEEHAVELYDLARDPGCTLDLAAQRPADARRLRALLAEWLASARPAGWNVVRRVHDAEELAELAELGYSTEVREDARAWFDPECECARCAAFR